MTSAGKHMYDAWFDASMETLTLTGPHRLTVLVTVSCVVARLLPAVCHCSGSKVLFLKKHKS